MAVDADDLTEGNNQGIVPVNAGKEPDWCHHVVRPVIPLSSSSTAKTCETTLKTEDHGREVTSASHVRLGPCCHGTEPGHLSCLGLGSGKPLRAQAWLDLRELGNLSRQPIPAILGIKLRSEACLLEQAESVHPPPPGVPEPPPFLQLGVSQSPVHELVGGPLQSQALCRLVQGEVARDSLHVLLLQGEDTAEGRGDQVLRLLGEAHEP